VSICVNGNPVESPADPDDGMDIEIYGTGELDVTLYPSDDAMSLCSGCECTYLTEDADDERCTVEDETCGGYGWDDDGEDCTACEATGHVKHVLTDMPLAWCDKVIAHTRPERDEVYSVIGFDDSQVSTTVWKSPDGHTYLSVQLGTETVYRQTLA
jgi:hypothetical protein